MCRANTNTHAGWNKRTGGIFFSKTINVQAKIRPCRGDFFLKINKRAGQIPIQMQENKRAGGFFSQINKRACTSIRHTRVHIDE